MDRQVRLRAVEPADVDMLYRLESEPQVQRVSWGEAPMSRQLIWEYVQNYTADICRDRQLRLIVELEGEAIGAVDITDYDPVNSRAMIGIAIDSQHWRKGYGHQALALAIDYCRGLNLHQIAAMVPADNTASIRLFATAGFQQTATLQQWLRRQSTYIDVQIYQLIL